MGIVPEGLRKHIDRFLRDNSEQTDAVFGAVDVEGGEFIDPSGKKYNGSISATDLTSDDYYSKHVPVLGWELNSNGAASVSETNNSTDLQLESDTSSGDYAEASFTPHSLHVPSQQSWSREHLFRCSVAGFAPEDAEFYFTAGTAFDDYTGFGMKMDGGGTYLVSNDGDTEEEAHLTPEAGGVFIARLVPGERVEAAFWDQSAVNGGEKSEASVQTVPTGDWEPITDMGARLTATGSTANGINMVSGEMWREGVNDSIL